MSNALFGLGRHNYSTKQISSTADTLKATALSMATAAGKIYLVTAATNASPIVISCAATTGITAGDVLVVGGVGGNLAANGTWVAGTVTGTTVQLLTLPDSNNSTGSAAYTSGGYMIDLSSASVLSDISGNSLGTDIVVPSVTDTLGIVNSSSWTWTSMPATKINACAIYDTTASNDLLAFYDGYGQIYVCTQASSSSTSIAIQRLSFAIPTGTVVTFSDGATATMTAQANIGDTALTVSSTAATIHRQATADVPQLSAGFGVTPAAGGNVSFTPDTNRNKLYAL